MFRKLKDKVKLHITDMAYYTQFLQMLISMFDYENLPIRKEEIETYLLINGNCGVFKENDKLICGYCNFTGNINEYGFGSDVTIITINGISKTFTDWENSKECVVIFNDCIRYPDVNIDRISKYLSDVDKSIENAVINTRINKVYRARDEKEKKALESAVDANKNGSPTAFVSSNILDEFLDSTSMKNNFVIDLTDPSKVDKIQYLCNLHTTFIRRMLNIYGMMSQGTDKIAQQTTAEINNGSTFSFVVPIDRLNERKKGVEKINENFGYNIVVHFSETIQREYNRIFNKESENTDDNINNIEEEVSNNENNI